MAPKENEKTEQAPENEGAALWRRTLEELLAKGATRTEAIDGANLILAVYNRQRGTDAPAAPQPIGEDTKSSGIRRQRRSRE